MNKLKYLKIFHLRLRKNKLYFLSSIVFNLTFFYYLKETSEAALVFSILFLLIGILRPKIFFLTLAILPILYISFYFRTTNGYAGYISGKYKVLGTHRTGFIISHDGSRIFIRSNINILKGDIAHITGVSKVVEGKYSGYYNSLNAKSIVFKATIIKIKESTSINNKVIRYLSNGPGSFRKFMPLTLLGIKNKYNFLEYKEISNANINYLFVVSGFHFGLLYGLIKLILKKAKPYQSDIIAITILLVYLDLLSYQSSALRSFIIIIGFSIKKYFKKFINQFDLLGFSLIIVVLINPFSLYSFSLPLSFTATFYIYIFSLFKLKEWQKGVIISATTSIALIPFILKMTNTIPLVSPIYSLVITPIFSLVFIISISLIWQKYIVSEIWNLFWNYLEVLFRINFKLTIPKTYSNSGYILYFIFLSWFIIYEIWTLYTEKKNTLLTPKPTS